MYRQLDGGRIVETCAALERRIGERFPGSGLSRVAGELCAVAQEAGRRIPHLTRPRLLLRTAVGGLIAVIVAVAFLAALQLRVPGSVGDLDAFVQLMESAINDVVFVGIAIAFLVTIEGRLKRREALQALHELRSLVHVVDMHQLTKDPGQFHAQRADTTSSPRRPLTAFELTRYLDYCSELLSLAGKTAALYAQHLDDAVVLGAVNEVEALATGISSKIWQKIVILGTTLHGPAGDVFRTPALD